MELCGAVEALNDVACFDVVVGVRADEQPRVIVDRVEDLGVLTVGELPVGDVGLPQLVRQLRFEADQGAAGPLLRLGNDQPFAPQDPPDRPRRGNRQPSLLEVVRDRDGPQSWPWAASSRRSLRIRSTVPGSV